ncbi:MAG: DUF2071 domain-containing protein [Planctomycetes bacterium]|jgi:uncharacterized protein YqjF (DUF2071 family)|nr:DUF2071 domain-containing protein [Planctomycetota bacterium]
MSTAIAIPTTAPTRVFLTAGWHHLAMLNFPIDSDILRPHVPAGTELDFWQGRTYVSVVGFQFANTSVLGIPLLFHRHFEEVNLRFYVVRPMPDGPRRGVVFLREIAPKLLISLAARWFYNENYVTMPMRQRVEIPTDRGDGLVEYEWKHGKRWNGLTLSTHGPAQPLRPGSEEEFIAEHYWGYTKQKDGSTMEYQVEHPSWRIHEASLVRYDCDVEAIYGKDFVAPLREPTSVFVADGSPVRVRRGLAV